MRTPIAWMGTLAVAVALSLPALAAPPAPGPTDLSGATMKAQLNTTVNTSNATVGEQVNATVLAPVKRDHEVLLPKGSELLGTVKNVNPGSSNAAAMLSVEFTAAVMPNGQRVPLKAGISGFDTAANTHVPADLTISSNELTGNSTISRKKGNFELRKGESVDVHDAGASWNH